MIEAKVSGAADERSPAIVTGTYWWNKPTLRALLSTARRPPVFIWQFDRALAAAVETKAPIYAWSSRLTGEQEAAAQAAGVPLFRIEDGFLRSIGLGAGFVTAASLAIDGRGIYYDASRPSDLEHLLQTLDLEAAEIADGGRIRHRIVEARLTKYNLSVGRGELPSVGDRPIVLVPGQVSDDASILKGVSATIDPWSKDDINTQLLVAARRRHPDSYIVFKPHPDVVSGLRNGHVPADILHANADLVIANGDIIELIDRADIIETISSLAGFEALIRGKSVATHGLPFYAGWGLTEDLTACERRTRIRSLEELTAIAFNHYTRHVNPYTRQECPVHELIDALKRQRNDRWHGLRNRALKQVAWLAERIKQ